MQKSGFIFTILFHLFLQFSSDFTCNFAGKCANSRQRNGPNEKKGKNRKNGKRKDGNSPNSRGILWFEGDNISIRNFAVTFKRNQLHFLSFLSFFLFSPFFCLSPSKIISTATGKQLSAAVLSAKLQVKSDENWRNKWNKIVKINPLFCM